jgi:membrane protease YdiL (CAAX protease family)
MPRTLAILEVVAVTALTHVSYKALKLLEPSGQNYPPGFVMIVVGLGMVLIHRRDFSSYGIVSPSWHYGLNVGMIFSAVMLMALLIEAALGGRGGRSAATTAAHVVCYGTASVATGFLLLKRNGAERLLHRIDSAYALLALAAFLVAAVVIALSFQAPVWTALSAVISLFLFTGFGEELFFRGYVQSRLNGVFGRPFRFLGVAFGPGLLLASLLFGAIHVFNPTRYFQGHWEFSPWWGVGAFFTGLFYSYLRELTKTIWAGAIVHGVSGVAIGIAQLFIFARG